MISVARKLRVLVPVLLFSLAGCGLKGPLYLPDEKSQEVPAPASTEAAKPVHDGSNVRLPPAPQSQKKDRERIPPSPVPPESPPDPVTTPPPGQ